MILSSLLSSSFSLPPPLSSDPHPLPIPSASLSSYPLPFRARQFLCPCRRRGARWDSNAESVRPGRFRFRDAEEGEEDGDPWRSDRKRRWWSDEYSDELKEEFDPFGDDDPMEEPLWDRIWIFKSALSLAIDKLWGKASEGPRTKPKTKKKPFARSASDFNGQWQDESSGDYRERRGYQSWVSADGGSPANVSDSRRPSFGGWDELDRQGDPLKGSVRGQQATANRSPPNAEPVKMGRLSKRGRYRDVPLFLRLLIAVFPFLGSWTRIL
ncbi:uncharacterized protein [Elaeis guineensis]|uniref:Uncharacterized protein LOC105059172 isoform X2 n=1 Tax=Elaeis guineensis var. tenera TaxID=51953 RepID=A0A6I9SJH2_ELAGV|nr:uncharacterized protein LOC105059172 isoform X2 [Elaeis guineensis]